MPHFTIRPLAWREINKQLDYLEEQAGLETAERFLDQLIKSFGTLAKIPKVGLVPFPAARCSHLRTALECCAASLGGTEA